MSSYFLICASYCTLSSSLVHCLNFIRRCAVSIPKSAVSGYMKASIDKPSVSHILASFSKDKFTSPSSMFCKCRNETQALSASFCCDQLIRSLAAFIPLPVFISISSYLSNENHLDFHLTSFSAFTKCHNPADLAFITAHFSAPIVFYMLSAIQFYKSGGSRDAIYSKKKFAAFGATILIPSIFYCSKIITHYPAFPPYQREVSATLPLSATRTVPYSISKIYIGGYYEQYRE